MTEIYNMTKNQSNQNIENIPDECFDTFNIWSNIILIGLTRDISIPQVITDIEIIADKDRRIHDENSNQLERTFIVLNILARKLDVHISELFNTDKEWIKRRVYRLLDKYSVDEYSTDNNINDEDFDYSEVMFENQLPNQCGTLQIKRQKKNSEYEYSYSIYMSLDIFFIFWQKHFSFSSIKTPWFYHNFEIYYEEHGKLKEFFDELCIKTYGHVLTYNNNSLHSESQQSINKKVLKENDKQNSTIEIKLKDFVVRREVFKCTHKDHEIENIDAIITIIDNNNSMRQITVSAAYCKQCNVYFIMESTYKNLKRKGIILCRVCDEKTFISNPYVGNMKLAKESILHQYGYNVGQGDGLSASNRQKILAIMIDKKILSKNEIIGYLDFFINQHTDTRFELAVSKWEEDREFIETYRVGEYTKFGINVIYRN